MEEIRSDITNKIMKNIRGDIDDISCVKFREKMARGIYHKIADDLREFADNIYEDVGTNVWNVHQSISEHNVPIIMLKQTKKLQ